MQYFILKNASVPADILIEVKKPTDLQGFGPTHIDRVSSMYEADM